MCAFSSRWVLVPLQGLLCALGSLSGAAVWCCCACLGGAAAVRAGRELRGAGCCGPLQGAAAVCAWELGCWCSCRVPLRAAVGAIVSLGSLGAVAAGVPLLCALGSLGAGAAAGCHCQMCGRVRFGALFAEAPKNLENSGRKLYAAK